MPLSSSQSNVVDTIKASDGFYIVKACPGSGKTHTIANLLLQELADWGQQRKGIAVLSFTNKASNEVLDKFSTYKNPNSLESPHFVGTFDKFFNQNVFLPFGRNYLGISNEPILVGEPFGEWRGIRLKWSKLLFEYVDYNTDGTLTDPSLYRAGMSADVYRRNKAEIHQMKRTVNQRGFFTQRDALFYAKQILSDRSDIAAILARRYPYIIIDEAQDSSDITMELVEILISHGVKKVVLVGDPDQAIYEWNNARPELFWSKWLDDAWTKLELNESYRSSEAICNFASAFSRVTQFLPAELNHSRNFPVKPNLEPLNISNYSNDPSGTSESVSQIKERFLRECATNGIEINRSNVAILCRSSADLPLIKGIEPSLMTVDWSKCEKPYTLELCLAKYLFEISKHDLAYKQWLKYSLRQDSDPGFISSDALSVFENEHGGRRVLFKDAMLKLNALPSVLADDIKSWVSSNIPSETKVDSLPEISFHDAFMNFNDDDDENQPLFSTIHGIKGATFDAVLLFLKKKGASGVHYKTYVNNEHSSLKDDNTEEMRIAYVAMTRPRLLLSVVVPDDDLPIWQSKFAELISQND